MTTVWKRIIASAVAWAMYPSINTLFLAAIVSTAVITDPKKDNYTCDVPKDNKATPIKIKEKCKSCNGLGFVRNNNPNSSSDITYKVCKTCNGSGMVYL